MADVMDVGGIVLSIQTHILTALFSYTVLSVEIFTELCLILTAPYFTAGSSLPL